MAALSRTIKRQKKHQRVRANLKLGTAARPRLNVFKSLKNFEAQLIDDTKGKTLIHASTISMKTPYGGNVAAAVKVGELMGEKIVKLGITEVVFDRGGYLYHGRVKSFADAVRAKGVKF